ncbi:Chromate resistance protein ChrB [Sinomonas flava]|uniref:Chromate resistance protein ChrB n=1 Tax=Sinomonas flava TaxID=496857 RepID=UPI0039A5FE57
MTQSALAPGSWVLLNYRMPRTPSSPRVAVWRRLQSLGVAQLGDGLVALPADARTKEHLEWIAADVEANGGTAVVWVGRPTSQAGERRIVAAMQDERRQEYLALTQEADAAANLGGVARTRAATRLQQQLRKLSRRDYFPPAEREAARAAVKALRAAGAASHPAPVTEEAGW